MRRSRLDLPLPLGPRSRSTSPGPSAKSRPSNTFRAPRRQASAWPANAAGRSISESPAIAREGNPDVRESPPFGDLILRQAQDEAVLFDPHAELVEA